MTDIRFHSPRAGEGDKPFAPRAAGLYGELPPVAIPPASPLFSTQTRRPGSRQG